MGEQRSLYRIDRHRANAAFFDPLQNASQTLDIHCLLEAVVDCFVHQRVIRNADWSCQIFGAGNLVGENGRQEVVGSHALQWCRDPFAPAESQNRKSSRCVPAPAGPEHRSREQRLPQHVFDCCSL